MDDVIEGIGEKIRLLRHGDRLSLQQLAERSGVSAASIHKIERNAMVPTITTLMKLARALDRSVSYLIEEEVDDSSSAVLVRSNERNVLFASRAGVWMENIAGPFGRFGMAGALVTVDAGCESGTEPLAHPGEELVYLISGRLEFKVDKDYHLKQGDSLHYQTDQPHSWCNPGTRPARALWISSRPS